MILKLSSVSKSFGVKNKSKITVLENINMEVNDGEWIGIVGESGSGKSTLAKIIMQMIPYDSGDIYFDGILKKDLIGKALSDYYKNIQMIFQDPLSAFSPRMRIEQFIIEPLINFGFYDKNRAISVAEELLDDVGLDRDKLQSYPHELSGGELQRVAIARTMGIGAKLIIFDEATSALDTKTQAKIIALLQELNAKKGFSAIFISHNIALIHKISNRTYVMKRGRIVEEFPSKELLQADRNTYTKLLVDAARLRL